MALIVEDGTGKADAESYISVADASAYHSSRGNGTWLTLLPSDAAKEAALRKATDYMLGQYRARWKGYRVGSTQALDWPRTDVSLDDGPMYNMVAVDVVPTAVKNACAELALRAGSGALAEDLGQGVLSETVGPISTTYDKGSPEGTRYQAVDGMLMPYLNGSSNNAKLVRR